MPFIGQQPAVGSYRLLDSITTSATDTFALTHDGVAFYPETAQNLIVSLNGVTQAPISAYTVVDSDIIFASALTASDVIDYILVLGDVQSIGTPSDNTVSTVKIVNDSVTSDKLAHNLSIVDLTISNTFTQGTGNYVQNRYVLHGTTTNSTETEIFTINSNGRVPVAANTTIFYEASFVARRTDATGESGAWHLKGVADNFSGTVADVGDVYEIAVAQDDVNLAVDIRADNTNDAVGVHVTGVTSKTYSWTVVLTTIEVTQ